MARKGVYYQLVMLQTLAEQEEHELSETGSLITEEERGRVSSSVDRKGAKFV